MYKQLTREHEKILNNCFTDKLCNVTAISFCKQIGYLFMALFLGSFGKFFLNGMILQKAQKVFLMLEQVSEDMPLTLNAKLDCRQRKHNCFLSFQNLNYSSRNKRKWSWLLINNKNKLYYSKNTSDYKQVALILN